MLKRPAENERKRKLWGDKRANRVGCIVGGWGDGNSEFEKWPVRTFQPIVRGKVVRKMHIIVSRCLFTLVMSLAVSFRVLCISLCRKTHLYSPERRADIVQRKASRQSRQTFLRHICALFFTHVQALKSFFPHSSLFFHISTIRVPLCQHSPFIKPVSTS